MMINRRGRAVVVAGDSVSHAHPIPSHPMARELFIEISTLERALLLVSYCLPFAWWMDGGGRAPIVVVQQLSPDRTNKRPCYFVLDTDR